MPPDNAISIKSMFRIPESHYTLNFFLLSSLYFYCSFANVCVRVCAFFLISKMQYAKMQVLGVCIWQSFKIYMFGSFVASVWSRWRKRRKRRERSVGRAITFWSLDQRTLLPHPAGYLRTYGQKTSLQLMVAMTTRLCSQYIRMRHTVQIYSETGTHLVWNKHQTNMGMHAQTCTDACHSNYHTSHLLIQKLQLS